MHYHFIAVGGSIMHNLALAIQAAGHKVTGSDDEIFEPSLSRLRNAGILPDKLGWNADNITSSVDAVILGMHARQDNPELLRAQQLGITIYSFPQFFYQQCLKQVRIVVGGSHGKTTTTAMIMHCLRTLGYEFNYLVGAGLEGFQRMVNFSPTARFAVMEGDEYLTSPLDPQSKFLHYKPHVAIITGIAWDHVNVFPTFEGYVDTFRKFAQSIQTSADCKSALIGFGADSNIREVAKDAAAPFLPYGPLPTVLSNDVLNVVYEGRKYPVLVFGEHNMSNMHAAMLALQCVGISPEQFLSSMVTFKGAAKRLQLIANRAGFTAYLDFAHSPSKLAATVEAVRARHQDRRLVALFELHTFSSLQKDFLVQYRGGLDSADEAAVYFNPAELEHKRLEPFTAADVAEAFATKGLKVFTTAQEVETFVAEHNDAPDTVLLLMSSGNFGGVNPQQILN